MYKIGVWIMRLLTILMLGPWLIMLAFSGMVADDQVISLQEIKSVGLLLSYPILAIVLNVVSHKLLKQNENKKAFWVSAIPVIPMLIIVALVALIAVNAQYN
jgi:amino acid transporter